MTNKDKSLIDYCVSLREDGIPEKHAMAFASLKEQNGSFITQDTLQEELQDYATKGELREAVLSVETRIEASQNTILK